MGSESIALLIAATADVMLYNEATKQWERPTAISIIDNNDIDKMFASTTVAEKMSPELIATGFSKVQLVQHEQNNRSTSRIVAIRMKDRKVLINQILFARLKYKEATSSFHQWRNENRKVIGLSFASEKDGKRFYNVVQSILNVMLTEYSCDNNNLYHYQIPSANTNSTNGESYDDQRYQPYNLQSVSPLLRITQSNRLKSHTQSTNAIDETGNEFLTQSGLHHQSCLLMNVSENADISNQILHANSMHSIKDGIIQSQQSQISNATIIKSGTANNSYLTLQQHSSPIYHQHNTKSANFNFAQQQQQRIMLKQQQQYQIQFKSPRCYGHQDAICHQDAMNNTRKPLILEPAMEQAHNTMPGNSLAQHLGLITSEGDNNIYAPSMMIGQQQKNVPECENITIHSSLCSNYLTIGKSSLGAQPPPPPQPMSSETLPQPQLPPVSDTAPLPPPAPPPPSLLQLTHSDRIKIPKSSTNILEQIQIKQTQLRPTNGSSAISNNSRTSVTSNASSVDTGLGCLNSSGGSTCSKSSAICNNDLINELTDRLNRRKQQMNNNEDTSSIATNSSDGSIGCRLNNSGAARNGIGWTGTPSPAGAKHVQKANVAENIQLSTENNNEANYRLPPLMKTQDKKASSASLNSIPIDPIDVDRLRDELSEMFRLELDRAKRELIESFRDELAQIISATIPSKMQLPDSQ